jgi:hypothetical protein
MTTTETTPTADLRRQFQTILDGDVSEFIQTARS